MCDLYIVLFNDVISDHPAAGHGTNGYYFGISDAHSWKDISAEIGRVLFEKGLIKSAEPTTYSQEELAKYFTSAVRSSKFVSPHRGSAFNSCDYIHP